MDILPTQKRTWAEVDLDAIRSNFRAIKNRVGDTKVCCTIKANGYGHGAVTLAKVYESEGADFFAVSNIEEALQLRRAGILTPILILGYTDVDCVELLAKYDISQSVFSYDYALALSKSAINQNVKVKVHIKLDTGMGRIGFLTCDKDLILASTQLEGFILEGLFTHFASADEGDKGREYTISQYSKYAIVADFLQSQGIVIPIKHCSNSAGISDYEGARFDMVRAGIILYGVQPSGDIIHPLDIRPALTLKTVVSHVKVLKKGECVSYGRTFTAPKDMVVATLPLGYADGVWRANFRRNMKVEIMGLSAPVIGRICMDQCIVDVTNIDGVEIGTIVTVYGDKDYNSVDTVAKNNETINYEILCAVGARVPRIYKSQGEYVSTENSICMKVDV